MGHMMKFLWIVLFLSLIGVGVILSMWGIPAPTSTIQKKLSIEALAH